MILQPPLYPIVHQKEPCLLRGTLNSARSLRVCSWAGIGTGTPTPCRPAALYPLLTYYPAPKAPKPIQLTGRHTKIDEQPTIHRMLKFSIIEVTRGSALLRALLQPHALALRSTLDQFTRLPCGFRGGQVLLEPRACSQ